jgi:hypothetical protein
LVAVRDAVEMTRTMTMTMTMTYEFTLRVNRELTDAEIEALYEAGCDDAGIETGPDGTLIEFSREAGSWAEALGSAVADIESVDDLMVVGAGQDDQVTMLDIARRAGRSREAVRLWASGKRGPGGFPAPSWTSPSGERFWSWPEVAAWLRDARGIELDVPPDEIWWADAILKTRVAEAEAKRLRAQAPAAFRREFQQRLKVA